MSFFPDDEGNELSTILSELQEESIAVSHDHGDQVMENVEGTVPEQTVVQKSDYDRMVEKMDQEFLKERTERREEYIRQLAEHYAEKIRTELVRFEEQDRAREEAKISSRNACIQRIDQSANEIRAELETVVKAEAESMMLKTGEKINQSTRDLRNEVQEMKHKTEEQMNSWGLEIKDQAIGMARSERHRVEEQINVLRVETQMQMENLRNMTEDHVTRELEYGLRKYAEAVQSEAIARQGPPRNLTEPQKDYYPEKVVQRDKVFEPRTEMRMGTVEGPEIDYAENVTTRSKSDKKDFFKEAKCIDDEAFRERERRLLTAKMDQVEKDLEMSKGSSNDFTNDPSIIEARFAKEMSRICREETKHLNRRLSAFEQGKFDDDYEDEEPPDRN